MPAPLPPFPANPIASALRATAEAGLAKIHAGLNIVGLTLTEPGSPGSAGSAESLLPSQYRYATVVERVGSRGRIMLRDLLAYLEAALGRAVRGSGSNGRRRRPRRGSPDALAQMREARRVAAASRRASRA